VKADTPLADIQQQAGRFAGWRASLTPHLAFTAFCCTHSARLVAAAGAEMGAPSLSNHFNAFGSWETLFLLTCYVTTRLHFCYLWYNLDVLRICGLSVAQRGAVERRRHDFTCAPRAGWRHRMDEICSAPTVAERGGRLFTRTYVIAARRGA